MKKFMKKALSAITVAAMAFTMVVVPSVKAEAADGDYILLGTITGWDASAGKMTDEGNGKYTYTYTASIGEKMEFKIANAELFANDGSWNTVIGDGNKSNFSYEATSETVVITYDSKVTDRAGVTVTGATNTKAIVSETFNIAGDEALTGKNWDNTANALTLSNGVYSITFTGIAAGTYSYKILENTASLEWNSDYVYGLRDVNSNNGVVTVAVDDSTVTFSVDATTKAVTVTQTVPQEDVSGDDTTPDDTTPADPDKNPSEDTSDVETDSVVNITEDEIKELEDAVTVEGAEEKLVISVVPEDSADLDVIAAALADVLKNVKYVAVDLKFESGNQPEEGTKITLPIAKIASVKDTAYVSVYRVDADKLKLIEVVKVTDGNITFEPDHFSTYVFAEANEADYNKYLNDQEAGVSLPIVGLIAVAALAGGCVVFSLKRKHA